MVMAILGSIFDCCAGYIYAELEYFTVVHMSSFSCIPTTSCLLIMKFLGV